MQIERRKALLNYRMAGAALPENPLLVMCGGFKGTPALGPSLSKPVFTESPYYKWGQFS